MLKSPKATEYWSSLIRSDLSLHSIYEIISRVTRLNLYMSTLHMFLRFFFSVSVPSPTGVYHHQFHPQSPVALRVMQTASSGRMALVHHSMCIMHLIVRTVLIMPRILRI